jgi:hypothetical protein
MNLIFFPDNKLLHALNKCEPEALRALPDPSLPSTDYRTIATLSDLCDRELVGTIGWAKQIPGILNILNHIFQVVSTT